MSTTAHMNATVLRKVNRELKKRGWGTYPGDDLGNGRRASGGFVGNMASYLAGGDLAGQREVEEIAMSVIREHYENQE